ncbi:GH92 family glycosyl hydrolase [Nitrospirillum sp. BR 11828]|uniref:GH92 family glycosyl hydrolase n=1 Tax=Nitrospirillum sp. BR 11828 TaxID=3104325 RepID=UPI002ACA4F7B|nr:GH92 family glycosyl hydrolase [Nitrospirillum sp. BR 11828]MDZ5645762.1 GH92 family glycosyl hydrolase [Nitrospirillum sp. BR 11828]
MLTRRTLLGGTAGLALLGGSGLPVAAAWAREGAGEGEDLTRWVDPFIGTGGHGHTYPGATVPFGMVQLSPDTDNGRWDSCSGYHQDDRTLMGFSHTHLSGTGVGDMLDVLVVPRVGPVVLQPGSLEAPEGGYRARFDHADEQATPGYYRVRLKDSGIAAELTATARAGLHRYTFPAGATGDSAHLLIDFHHGMQDKHGVPTRVTDATLRLVGNDTLVGGRRVHQWADGRHIYFALKLSRPFTTAQLYSDDQPVAGDQTAGTNLKCALHLADAAKGPLLVKVGLSAVDVDGALRNLQADLPGWDFDRVRGAARDAWQAELSRIRIDADSDVDRRIFYSALYHALLAPTLFSDVDGRYRGMDDAVHQMPAGRHTYSTYSLWDTYRALHPLFTLVQPERVPDLVDGLVRMAVESPAGPPVWPLQGRETGCMIGWHSAVVLAEAQAKGFKGIDYKAAWPVFRKRAFEDTTLGMGEYRRLGYIPSDTVDEAVSRTLEYAYDDWAMAHLAAGAGARDDARALVDRSRNYRHVFDPALTFVRARDSAGKWIEPFDPRAMGHMKKWRDFTESNAWQATFLNQHDLYGYMGLFGGPEAFERKLDELFTTSSEMPADAPPDIAGLVGQYAHGNEPSHHVAYLYAYAGAHHKTQARVRMLLRTMHQDQPDGLAGNEDCGQMSAWYLMSALGLYAVDPVTPIYVFGSPLFRRAEVVVGPGRRLVVEAPGNGADSPYIQSVSWNGAAYTKSWISHASLAAGGRLTFQMGPKPNPRFGADPADRPPSFTPVKL